MRRDVETILLPALKKLGLDPTKIKYAIITHGHADHFGGAFYLQEHFGTHVEMSSEDWTTVMTAPPSREWRRGGARADARYDSDRRSACDAGRRNRHARFYPGPYGGLDGSDFPGEG